MVFVFIYKNDKVFITVKLRFYILCFFPRIYNIQVSAIRLWLISKLFVLCIFYEEGSKVPSYLWRRCFSSATTRITSILLECNMQSGERKRRMLQLVLYVNIFQQMKKWFISFPLHCLLTVLISFIWMRKWKWWMGMNLDLCCKIGLQFYVENNKK